MKIVRSDINLNENDSQLDKCMKFHDLGVSSAFYKKDFLMVN